MNAQTISVFANELEKNAAVPQLLGKIWNSGAGRALAGGAVGAGAGALANPEDRLRGAIIGGAAGAGAGYVSPLATSAGRAKALQYAKYMGKKTGHEVTGMGSAVLHPGGSMADLNKLRKLEEAGLTSVPGIVGGLATKPLKTLKGAWNNSGRMGKAFALADVATGVPHVMDENTQAGTAEKALGTLGSSAGYMLGGRMGMLGSMAVGGGLGYVGGKMGKVFGGGKPAVAPAPAGALAPAVARPAQLSSVPTNGSMDRAVLPSPSVFARRQLSKAVPEVGRLVGPT